MKGILVVNHFLMTEKFNELHAHLADTARKLGIDLSVETNLHLATKKSVDADFVLFWDKDINLAKRLELMGLPVFNSSKAIELCDDKAKTYLQLLGSVQQPETIISPKVFFESDLREFAEKSAEILGLPLVFKECFGSFGAQVWLCSSVEEILSHITEKSFVLQSFVAESSGRDKRIEVVGGRVVAAVRRENNNDFRSNVTNGGTMSSCIVSDREAETAIKACELLGLDFGGVDILDNGMVCEVNSNAHIINIMKATGIDIAPLIFEHILEKIR